jgi:putative acetyltransferase
MGEGTHATGSMAEIIDVTESPEYMPVFASLVREYGAELGINLNFQGFEEELATLPGRYAAPEGCILLAGVDDQIAGCVGLRPLDESTAEIKRMYVKPAFRRRGIARLLADSVLGFAYGLAYRRARLDTLNSMTAARTLYESFGFKEIAAYYHNPIPGVIYYELDFHADARERVSRHAAALGTGRWAVIFTNDDETGMDQVVEIIQQFCAYEDELAVALMNLTHLHGSAIIRRFEQRIDAADLAARIRGYCGSNGIPLRVSLYEIPADRLHAPPA